MFDMAGELKGDLKLSQVSLKKAPVGALLKFVHMATLGEMILAARRRKRLTQEQLGQVFGVTGATVSQWESDETAPAQKRLPRLARELDLDIAAVHKAIEEKEAGPAQGALPIKLPPSNARAVTVQPPASDDPRPDIPVWASAAGNEDGTIVITEQPIDWIKRSELMRDTVNPFAFFVVGDSMSEVIEHGDQVVIHPGKLPQAGKDHVFVHEAEGFMLATVKRLVRIKPNAWRVKQFNPAKEFDLPKDKWTKALRITEKRYG